MTKFTTKKAAQTAAKGRGCVLSEMVFFKDGANGWLWREKEEDLTPTVTKQTKTKHKTPAQKKNTASKKEIKAAEADSAEKARRKYENHSTCGGPVAMTHEICAEMGMDAKRKDVLAACEAQGITYHTARTQIQVWRKGMKNDAEAKLAAKAAKKKAKATKAA